MALTKVSTDSAGAVGLPDKLIFSSTTTSPGLLYTVPSGRKFIGYANVGTSGSFAAGSTNISQGTTTGGSYPIYLSGGTSISGSRCNISGIESDA